MSRPRLQYDRPRGVQFIALVIGLVSGMAPLACGDDEGAVGLGRAPAGVTAQPSRLAVTIEGITTAEKTTANETTSAATMRLSVCAGCTIDPLELRGGTTGKTIDGSKLGAADIDVSSLFGSPFPAVGELAIVDKKTGFVHDHFAWGADPSTVSSPYWLGALVNAQRLPRDFVKTGFPAVGAAALRRDGCADSLDGPVNPDPCATDSQENRLTLVREEMTVFLSNSGSADIDLLGVRLCGQESCATVSARSTLKASERQDLGPAGLNLVGDPAASLNLYAPGAVDITGLTPRLSLP